MDGFVWLWEIDAEQQICLSATSLQVRVSPKKSARYGHFALSSGTGKHLLPAEDPQLIKLWDVNTEEPVPIPYVDHTDGRCMTLAYNAARGPAG